MKVMDNSNILTALPDLDHSKIMMKYRRMSWDETGDVTTGQAADDISFQFNDDGWGFFVVVEWKSLSVIVSFFH